MSLVNSFLLCSIKVIHVRFAISVEKSFASKSSKTVAGVQASPIPKPETVKVLKKSMKRKLKKKIEKLPPILGNVGLV